MVVLDAMEKCARVRVLETELNDAPGVCIKLHGPVSDLESAARAAEAVAAAPRALLGVVEVLAGAEVAEDDPLATVTV